MIERVCAMCGGAWSKTYKFCPSDGTVLVAVDTVIARAPRVKRPLRTSDEELAAARPRRASTTRDFRARDGAPAETPVFTLRKRHTPAAFVETACHRRPGELELDAQGVLPLPDEVEGPPTARTATQPRPRLTLVGELIP